MRRWGIPHRAQADLPKEPEFVRALVRETDVTLEAGAAVATSGTVRRGDPIEVL